MCSLAAIILQGCGAERSEPFAPIVSSSCSSSSSSSSSSLDFLGTDLSSSSSSSSSSSCSSSSSSSSSSSNSSSSSSSSVLAVEVIQLWSATNTVNEISPAGKNHYTFSTADDFDKSIVNYMDKSLLGTADYFTNGQVIIVYDGEVNSCAARVEHNGSISAYDLDSVSVKVTLGYLAREAIDKCSPTISHPFTLYQIKTKKQLIFEEKIQ